MLRTFQMSLIYFDFIHIFYYEGETIVNQLDLFLTDTHNQHFYSVFSHHNKTYVHNLSSIGSLVDNLSHLQAWALS